jgi:hypothetical protein
LADALSSPYTALTAYSAGLIDAQGNVLKPESSIDPFEYLVIKLKKIFDQLPYGMTRARLGNYLSTLQMFSEEVENFDITQEQFHCLVEGFVTQYSNAELSYLELLEDMATGGGAGALGVPAQGGNINQGGISGFDPPLGMPIQRRKQPKYFDNCEVFEVCPEEFLQLKAARTWKEVPEGDTKNYLQRFQRRNKGGKIAVKSLNPLNAEHELHWINYPAKNFMEDVDLSFFSELLTETNDMNPNRVDGPDAGSQADSSEVATGQEQLQRRWSSFPSLRVSLRVQKPTDPQKLKHWQNNVKSLGLTEPKEGISLEKHMVDTMRQKLVSSKFEERSNIDNFLHLKAGEFAFFSPGKGRDLVVGIPHPTKGVHHVKIELKYKSPKSPKSTTIEPQYAFPQGTIIPVKGGLSGLKSSDFDTEIDVTKFFQSKIPDLPGGDTNKALYAGRGAKKSKTRSVFQSGKSSRVMTWLANKFLPRLMKTKDDVSIVGNAGGLSVIPHHDEKSDEYKLSTQLLDQLGLKETHKVTELTHARAPYFGSSFSKTS